MLPVVQVGLVDSDWTSNLREARNHWDVVFVEAALFVAERVAHLECWVARLRVSATSSEASAFALNMVAPYPEYHQMA